MIEGLIFNGVSSIQVMHFFIETDLRAKITSKAYRVWSMLNCFFSLGYDLRLLGTAVRFKYFHFPSVAHCWYHGRRKRYISRIEYSRTNGPPNHFGESSSVVYDANILETLTRSQYWLNRRYTVRSISCSFWNSSKRTAVPNNLKSFPKEKSN